MIWGVDLEGATAGSTVVSAHLGRKKSVISLCVHGGIVY